MASGFQTFVCGDCWKSLWSQLWQVVTERKVKFPARNASPVELPRRSRLH